jgi:hypothetical protein
MVVLSYTFYLGWTYPCLPFEIRYDPTSTDDDVDLQSDMDRKSG